MSIAPQCAKIQNDIFNTQKSFNDAYGVCNAKYQSWDQRNECQAGVNVTMSALTLFDFLNKTQCTKADVNQFTHCQTRPGPQVQTGCRAFQDAILKNNY